jgi:hypothetical protein
MGGAGVGHRRHAHRSGPPGVDLDRRVSVHLDGRVAHHRDLQAAFVGPKRQGYGRWELSDSILTFDQEADTFMRDGTFVYRGSSTIEGTAPDLTQIVLTEQ